MIRKLITTKDEFPKRVNSTNFYVNITLRGTKLRIKASCCFERLMTTPYR